jgi:hypothetical protein
MTYPVDFRLFQFHNNPVFIFLGDLCFSASSKYMMEAAGSCETSVLIYRTIWRHVPEDTSSNVNIHHHDNVKSKCCFFSD